MPESSTARGREEKNKEKVRGELLSYCADGGGGGVNLQKSQIHS